MVVSAPKIESTGYSAYLRRRLKQARDDQKLRQQDVADRVAEILGKPSHTGEAIGQYERFERHPPINVFAAWARALGLRLIVGLATEDEDLRQVIVSPDVATAANMLEGMPPRKRRLAIRMIKELAGELTEE